MAGRPVSKKRQKQHKKKRTPALSVILALTGLLCVALYISGGLKEHRPSRRSAEAIQRNVSLLSALSAREVPAFDAPTEDTAAPEENGADSAPIIDEAAEQEKILTLNTDEITAAQLQRRYKNAALVGDSLADDARGYGWLQEAVVAKIGSRALQDSPLLDEVEAKNPQTIFLTFGTNDVEVYGENVSVFISRYKQVIMRLQESCPQSRIIVQAVMPVREDVVKRVSNMQYIDLYNEELKAACEFLGVTFVDAGFIMREMPELIQPDGIHFGRSGYPYWLTYLADEAGLPDE